jgi:YggT family protein
MTDRSSRIRPKKPVRIELALTYFFSAGTMEMTSSFNPATVIATFLNIYFALLLIRVLLTWFPTVDWSAQPFTTLSQLTDPYLNIFRSIIPPIGGIDISAMLAIFLIQFLQSALPSIVGTAMNSLSGSLLG